MVSKDIRKFNEISRAPRIKNILRIKIVFLLQFHVHLFKTFIHKFIKFVPPELNFCFYAYRELYPTYIILQYLCLYYFLKTVLLKDKS